MVVFYYIAAFFSSWMWVDYFRLIGVATTQKTKYLLLTFCLGVASFYVFKNLNTHFLDQFEFLLHNNKILNHFLVTAFKIGFLGELSKVIPVLIVYYLFRNKLQEPIDVFMFFSVSALGFAAGENLLYSYNNEFYFFNEKIILRTFGEVVCTSILAYGIIGYRFYHKRKKPLKIVLLFLLAVFLHSFYDFWLAYERVVGYGFIFTIVYFMCMISIYATTLTNSLNFSSDFDDLKTIDSKNLIKKMYMYYGIFIVLQFFILFLNLNYVNAEKNVINTFWFSAFIVFVVINRLMKLKKIKGRWSHLKLELPFTFYKIDSFNGRSVKYKFKFRGEIFNEIFVDAFLNKVVYIFPLSQSNSYIVKSKKAVLENKIYLKDDEVFYIARIIDDEKGEVYLLKLKNSGKSLRRKKYPIVALLSVFSEEDLQNKNLTVNDFQFREWVYLKDQGELRMTL